MLNDICCFLENSRDQIIAWQRALTAIPALGPLNGGQGERAKADFLHKVLCELELDDIEEITAPDPSVDSKGRPNLAAKVRGLDHSRTFWVISHTDIVPPGDPALWSGDPYQLRVEGDKLIGRGVEDNQQGIVVSLLLAKALKELGLTPPVNLGLLFVADEETGSQFGLDYIVRERPLFFSPKDLILVPDFGEPSSITVEVAEKHTLWLKISVYGRQCHASTPEEGRNSLLAASDFIMRLRGLSKIYSAVDHMFHPPVSTFEPTKKEANVPNINTVPGLDVFYLDCRVLPGYSLDAVYMSIRDIGCGVEADHQVKIEYQIVQRGIASPPTDEKAEIVVKLCEAIGEVYGHPGQPIGIGGGTVASILRRSALPAAVWATWQRNAHQPDESALISSHIGDAKVMAHVLMR